MVRIIAPEMLLRRRTDPAGARARASIMRARDARARFFSALQYSPDYFGGYGADSCQYILDAVQAYGEGRVLPPETAELQLSKYCQWKCLFCTGEKLSQGEEPGKEDGSFFTEETTRTVVRQLAAYWREFGITGEIKLGGSRGDPLTRRHLVRAGIEEALRAREQGEVKLGVFTNGRGLTKEAWPYLNHASYVFWSRNAASDETLAKIALVDLANAARSTERVKAFAQQRPSGVNLFMGYTIMPANIGEAEAAIAYAREIGCDGVRFKFDLMQPAPTPGYRSEATALQAKLIEAAKKDPNGRFRVWAPHLPFDFYPRPEHPPASFFGLCLAQFNVLAADDNGGVHGCYLGALSNPRLKFGDLRTSTVKQIWEGERRRRLVGEFPSENCVVCPTAPWFQNTYLAFARAEHLAGLPFIKEKMPLVGVEPTLG